MLPYLVIFNQFGATADFSKWQCLLKTTTNTKYHFNLIGIPWATTHALLALINTRAVCCFIPLSKPKKEMVISVTWPLSLSLKIWCKKTTQLLINWKPISLLNGGSLSLTRKLKIWICLWSKYNKSLSWPCDKYICYQCCQRRMQTKLKTKINVYTAQLQNNC